MQSYNRIQKSKMTAVLFEEQEKSDLYIMRIAVVTATELEMQPIRAYLSERLFLRKHHRFDLWVSGVGIMHTTYALSRALSAERPDIAIQAGVGGAFHPLRHPIGTCVAVGSEIQADLGVMEPGGIWKGLPDMGLMDADLAPYNGGRLLNPNADLLARSGLPVVNGVTVNQVSTDPEIISRMAHQLAADVESMEGAAFHFACLQSRIPFLQLRGLSNLIGDRDKSRWHMAAALNSVRDALFLTIDRLLEN
jgi:futalosine hydrolase